jgi:hypothetical protein
VTSVRPMMLQDFHAALRTTKPSVGEKELVHYRTWNREYGSWQQDDEEKPPTQQRE